jgi:hypothetical protein
LLKDGLDGFWILRMIKEFDLLTDQCDRGFIKPAI